MEIFISTTCFGTGNTSLKAALSYLKDFDVQGLELGSTHCWEENLESEVGKMWGGQIFTHNYFPPAREDLVIDIASDDDDVRNSSISHAQICIDVASRLGANLYTIHPGFATSASLDTAGWGARQFDFKFSDSSAIKRSQRAMHMYGSLKKLISYATQRDVRLAVETQGSITSPNVSLLETIEDFNELFNEIPDGLMINFNLAHTIFAAHIHRFQLDEFVEQFRDRFAAVEISHNDGKGDQHSPLVPGSFALDWIARLKDIPIILEFRDASRYEIETSISLARIAIRAAA
jgi:sugar phosphate isomerase/epimerase